METIEYEFDSTINYIFVIKSVGMTHEAPTDNYMGIDLFVYADNEEDLYHSLQVPSRNLKWMWVRIEHKASNPCSNGIPELTDNTFADEALIVDCQGKTKCELATSINKYTPTKHTLYNNLAFTTTHKNNALINNG